MVTLIESDTCTTENQRCIQVIVHDGDVQADLVHVLWGYVKDDGFIISGVQCVLFDGGLLLFQTPPVANERHFYVGICGNKINMLL